MTYSLNFRILPLDKIYQDFNFKFIQQTCNLCNNYPYYGEPYICLICEKIFCSVKCRGE